MPRARITQSKIVSLVDKKTGEISLVETEKSYSIQTPTEEFIQVYFRLIACVYELNSANDIKVLIKFCEIAQYNTGEVIISTFKRKVICEELSMHSSNLSKSIKRLVDKNLLIGGKGTYTINPAIFWKGEQKVRAQILKEGSLSVILNFRDESK